MVPIKHILYEYGVDQIFKLIVPSGIFAGTYIVNQPSGWDEVESIVNVNDETFNVEDFIVGSNTKLKFLEFTNKTAYDLIKNVYNEQGGDGRIIFKWIAEKSGAEYDLLGENFELNLNKYADTPEKNYMKIEVELIKSEAQNKIYTRDDTTVNLFEEKDLDENDIDPIEVFTIGYKKGDKTLTNFYTYNLAQIKYDDKNRKDHFFSFSRGSDYEFGDNANDFAGYKNNPFERIDQGPFISTNITLKSIKIAISSMNVIFKRDDGGNPNVRLDVIVRNGGTVVYSQKLKDSETTAFPGETAVKIDYAEYVLNYTLSPGQNLTFMFYSNENMDFKMYLVETQNVSIKITSDMESPLVRTTGIRLITALNQLIKNYSAGEIGVVSNVIGNGGVFYNTSISTGMYLRGLPPIYLLQKIKTSFKSLFNEGAAKLLALGYDVNGEQLIVEDIDYFFKDQKCYDLSEKLYLNEGFKIENDTDVSYNSLLFGSKKYSTNVKFDIKNFNTSIEISTPIKSNKNKFDKQTDCIIDPYKIQELIEDKSSSTNDNDDDLVLIDMVEVVNHIDDGVFDDCTHIIENGKLVLKCASIPFDTTMIQVGQQITISEGLNVGNWNVLSISGLQMVVDKTSGIEEGTADTRIRYKIDSLIKNRTIEGFTGYDDTIRNPETTTNIRHNPKYQMARWFPYFGSGLRKKTNTELLKVTSYKNNSEAKMKIVPPEMPNELRDEIIVGGNETLGRMRDYRQTFFNGEKIEISFSKVTFAEFFLIYSNWKFGEGNDRLKSRGYISCNTPYGIYDVYPFGQEAFKHNKATNTLTIKGKIKGKSVDNPVLLSVVQEDRNTLTLTWDYVIEYINPVVKIQYSLDGINWETVHTVSNVKTATFSNNIFNSILTGTDVYFRIVVNTADYYNKASNTRVVSWQFNDWILREVSRTENINCGYSYLTLELTGTVDLDIKWNYEDDPGGGNYVATDLVANTIIASFDSPYGSGNADEKIIPLSLSAETKTIYIQLKNSDKTTSGTPLNCNSGNMLYTVESSLNIEFKDLATDETTSFFLRSRIFKRYIDLPLDPDPGTP